MAIVSVIVERNASEEAINQCLESLSAQTFTDFEIIKAARNEGLSNASGKYVYFIYGDGMIFDNGLELLVKAAESSEAEIIHSTTYVERDGENVEIISNRELLPLNLYRRDFLEQRQLKFPEFGDDSAFMYAAKCLASNIRNIDEYFYVGTRHEERSSDGVFVRDINRDEIRDGFLVTSQRKKLWNAQIKLINQFARICRKYKLKWFTYAGTMLGTVRHKGFIPWDDDVDLAMMRPDYMKFKEIAMRELKPPYCLDAWYNYAIEGEPNDEKLPSVSKKLLTVIQERGWAWPTVADFIKIRDNSTTMIQWKDRPNFNQGIWIDIFPFDPVPPFDTRQHELNYEIKKELLMTASYPHVVREALQNGETLLIGREKLEYLLSLPFKQRALAYDEYAGKTFFDSKYVRRFVNHCLKNKDRAVLKSITDETIEMPFELTTVQVMRDYDLYLTVAYGDWREMIFKKAHMSTSTVDISYKEFFAQVSPAIKEFNF